MKLIKKAYLVCLPYRQRPPLIVFFYDIVSLVYITIYLFFDIFGPFAKNSFRNSFPPNPLLFKGEIQAVLTSSTYYYHTICVSNSSVLA